MAEDVADFMKKVARKKEDFDYKIMEEMLWTDVQIVVFVAKGIVRLKKKM